MVSMYPWQRVVLTNFYINWQIPTKAVIRGRLLINGIQWLLRHYHMRVGNLKVNQLCRSVFGLLNM